MGPIFGVIMVDYYLIRKGMIDVNALIGPYPFRFVPHPDPEVLVRQEAERAPLFAEVARYVVESTKHDKDEVADEIVRLLAQNG